MLQKIKINKNETLHDGRHIQNISGTQYVPVMPLPCGRVLCTPFTPAKKLRRGDYVAMAADLSKHYKSRSTAR